MTLDALIYERLTSGTKLPQLLTGFNQEPALFYQRIPDVNHAGWTGGEPYPCVMYSVSMRPDHGKGSVGSVKFKVYSQDGKASAEEIESDITAHMNHVFWQPEGEALCYLKWAETEPFLRYQTVSGEKLRLSMLIIHYDILEYSNQGTMDPDPIWAMAEYVKKWMPAAKRIGFDSIEDMWEMSGNEPGVYLRLMNVNTEEDTNTVRFMTGKIAIHIFAPTQALRLKWGTYLTNQLSLDGSVELGDQAPMRIISIQSDFSEDYVKTGQIIVEARYGLPRYRQKLPQINSIKAANSGL